jgi:hypothetical protein
MPEPIKGIHDTIKDAVDASGVAIAALESQLTALKEVCDKILDIVDKKLI